jgi:DNA-binding NtrC family response regulator/polyferredoxin
MNRISSKRRTILAVDDKIENLKVLIKYLEDSGFELMVAQSGVEAFNHIDRVTPDMILLDVLMPGIDGFETCRRLKKNPVTQDIPVIFMTALTDTMDKVKGFEVGAIDYITKPLQHDEVLARVNAHMNTVEFQQQLKEKNVLLQQKITVFSSLMQIEAYSGPIIAKSSAMGKVQEQITELSKKQGPILITGEPGAGKFYIGKKIHELLGDTYTPLIVVDCMKLENHEAGKLLFGSSNLYRFENRMEGFGALHLADQGTLILRHIETLDLMSQKKLSKYLEELGEKEDIPKINLIATTSGDLLSLVETDRFFTQLADQLTKNILKIPNVYKRRRDIIPLARLFLDERNKRLNSDVHRLGRSAEHALLSCQYRQRNADELREAVEVAALFADDTEIVAENIFTGPKSEGTPFDYKLSQLKWVQWLINSDTPIFVLKILFFVVFFSIVLICLSFENTTPGRIANNLIWGLWEPLLIFTFLFVGRLWCTVCPISSAGRIAQRIGCFEMNPPRWLIEYSGWIIVTLFFLVIWSEHVFNMTEHPYGTSILFLCLMFSAILFSILFKRESWCRYLCPLGNVGATYAVASMVYLRANPNVCITQCNTHECYKGSPTSHECPVFHHPLYVRDGHFCKMCLACLRSCPHGSTNLYLRPPIQSIWHQSDLSPTMTPLALVVFFMAIVLLVARTKDWMTSPYQFTMMAVLAVIFAIILLTVLKKFFTGKRFPDSTIVSRIALALFILSWGPLMAYHLQEFPIIDALRIRIVEESYWTDFLPLTEINILMILQLGVILIAAIFAMVSLWRIWSRFLNQEIKSKLWVWSVILGLSIVYILTSVGIFLL